METKQEVSQTDEESQQKQSCGKKAQSKKLVYISVIVTAVLLMGGIATGIYFGLDKNDDPNPSPANILNRSEKYSFNQTLCQSSHNDNLSEGEQCVMIQGSITKLTISKNGSKSLIAISLNNIKIQDIVKNLTTNETSYIQQFEQKYSTDDISTEQKNQIPVIYYVYDEVQKTTTLLRVPKYLPEFIVQILISIEHHTTFQSLPSVVNDKAKGRRLLQGDVQNTYQVGDAQFTKYPIFKQMEGGQKMGKLEINPGQHIGGSSNDEIQKNYYLNQTSVMDKDNRLQYSSIKANRIVNLSIESQNTLTSNVLEIMSISILTLEEALDNNENLVKFFKQVEQKLTLVTYDLQNITKRTTEPEESAHETQDTDSLEESDLSPDSSDTDQREVNNGVRRIRQGFPGLSMGDDDYGTTEIVVNVIEDEGEENIDNTIYVPIQDQGEEIYENFQLDDAKIFGLSMFVTSTITKEMTDESVHFQYFLHYCDYLITKLPEFYYKYSKRESNGVIKVNPEGPKQKKESLDKKLFSLTLYIIGHTLKFEFISKLSSSMTSVFNKDSQQQTVSLNFLAEVAIESFSELGSRRLKGGVNGSLFNITNDHIFSPIFNEKKQQTDIAYNNNCTLHTISMEKYAQQSDFVQTGTRSEKRCYWYKGCNWKWFPVYGWTEYREVERKTILSKSSNTSLLSNKRLKGK